MNSRILPLLICFVVLASCGSSKKYQASYSEDKPLYAAINALKKKPGNERARDDLKILYKKSVERHEESIDVYKSGNDEQRWDKILSEYYALQHIYTSLEATPGSFGIVKPKNYLRDIEDTKVLAAEDYYTRALDLLEDNTRESSLMAWQYFKRSNEYVNGYKDVAKQIKDAYEKGIVDVVINPVEEDNVFFPTGGNWNNGFPDMRYRPQEYQDQLVRELGGRSASYYPARFYNDRDVRRDQIVVDWEVNMRWRSINPIRSNPQQLTRKVSKSVESGKDTTGKPTYTTVYATLYITQNSFMVQGEIEYRINDIASRTTIDNGSVRDEVNWTESTATYSGDSRALSQDDWIMVNNRNSFNQPSKADVMNTLMRKIYPDLKRRIQQSVD